MQLSYLFICISLLFTANLTSGHAISTTTTTTTITSSAQSTTSTSKHTPPKFTLVSSYNITAITNPANASLDLVLPTLPLAGNQLNGINSLLTLITSVPDNVLSSNETLTSFFTSLSSCLQDPIQAITSSVSEVIPALGTLAQEVESSLEDAASKVTSVFGSVTSQIPGAISTAETAIVGLESKVTAAIPAIATQASGIVESIGDEFADLAHAIHLPFEMKRDKVVKRGNLEDTLNKMLDISACISNTLDANPVFQVGNCALKLAELVVPVGRLLRVKSLLGLVGGNVPFIQRLGGVDPKGIKGGNGVDGADGKKGANGVDGSEGEPGDIALDLLKELVGINDVVDACKFLVEG